MQTKKTAYSVLQNVSFMTKLAWNREKTVLLFIFLSCIVRVSAVYMELILSPTILGKVENKVPFSDLVLTVAFFSVGLLICKGLANYIQTNKLFGRVRLRASLVNMLHTKLCTTSYPNTEDSSCLKLFDKASMAISGNDEAGEAIWSIIENTIHDVACLIICILILTTINPLLMLLSLVTSVGGYLLTKKINEWSYRHRDEEAEYSKRMNYIIDESQNIALAKDIRIFGMRSWLEELFQRTMKLYSKFVLRGEKVYIWSDIIGLVLTLLRNGIVYAYLIGLTITQNLHTSEFLLYFAAINGFAERVGYIMYNISTLHTQSLSICSIREFLNLKEPFKFEDGKTLEPDSKKEYELTLKDVSFRYPDTEKDILSHVNLTIKPGEKLAIVGLNGAGKTTLVKLLCGFYDPTEGAVLLNGEDVRQYNRQDYYRHFTAVFQQFSLLEAPMDINISQEFSGIDEEKVAECLNKAGIMKKVSSLPQGIHTNIGRKVFEDGIELSGGQTQRLMLARALYKNAPIIVLDEPTAALDPIAEDDMYQKYSSLTEGRTSVYISHRLASTRFCDRIVYLESGLIKEEGTHQELLSQKGKYAELYLIQSKYYQEGVKEDVI